MNSLVNSGRCRTARYIVQNLLRGEHCHPGGAVAVQPEAQPRTPRSINRSETSPVLPGLVCVCHGVCVCVCVSVTVCVCVSVSACDRRPLRSCRSISGADSDILTRIYGDLSGLRSVASLLPRVALRLIAPPLYPPAPEALSGRRVPRKYKRRESEGGSERGRERGRETGRGREGGREGGKDKVTSGLFGLPMMCRTRIRSGADSPIRIY